MRTCAALAALGLLCQCDPITCETTADEKEETTLTRLSAPVTRPQGSWAHFLQSLPQKDGPVLDYTGRPVEDQDKHIAILSFDVGRQDLQQCADALIRLRAEYLFEQKKDDSISFTFASGHRYSWKQYLDGVRPVPQGHSVRFSRTATTGRREHAALRRYLDLVYAYASTISLARDLRPADGFQVGTIIVWPGSPGHCCIVIDEKVTPDGKRLFKLAEGYMPAQTIYVLKNPADGSPWHELEEGRPFRTASYSFERYQLRRF